MNDRLHTALKELAPDHVDAPNWAAVETRVGRARRVYRLQVAAVSLGAVVLAGAAVFGLAQVNPGNDVIGQPDQSVPDPTPTESPTTQLTPDLDELTTAESDVVPPAVPGSGFQDPLDASLAFLEGIATSNWEQVEGMLSSDSRSLYADAAALEADQQTVRARWGFSGERFEVIELNESTRIVVIGEYAEAYIDFTAAVTLVFENGGWLVELDSSTSNPTVIERPEAFDPFSLIELEPESTVEWESRFDLLSSDAASNDETSASFDWRAFFDSEELETSTNVSETSVPHVSVSALPNFDPDGGPYFLTLVMTLDPVDGPEFLDIAVFAVNQPPGGPQTSEG